MNTVATPNVIETNKLIAEFMGAKIGNGGSKKYPVYTGVPVTHSGQTQTWTFGCKDLKYNLSWEWLMPVIEKIAKTKTEDGEDTYYPRTFGAIDEETGKAMVRINRNPLFLGSTLIEAAYDAVVFFISK